MATVLVTGANRGIGLALCRELKVRGEDVIATCRSSSRELQSLHVRLETGVDVGDGVSVNALAGRLKGQTIDVLILNAGTSENIPPSNLDFTSIRRQFEVNALGPLRVVRALMPNLRKGSKSP